MTLHYYVCKADFLLYLLLTALFILAVEKYITQMFSKSINNSATSSMGLHCREYITKQYFKFTVSYSHGGGACLQCKFNLVNVHSHLDPTLDHSFVILAHLLLAEFCTEHAKSGVIKHSFSQGMYAKHVFSFSLTSSVTATNYCH